MKRQLPKYQVVKHVPPHLTRRIEVNDFCLRNPESEEAALGAPENSDLSFESLGPRPAGTGLRWINLLDTNPETFQHLAASRKDKSFQTAIPALFTLSPRRFGLSKYSQNYAESVTEVIYPVSGYPNDASAKPDAQLAIYLPYFKWSPPIGRRQEYPSLSDYAQPQIFSSNAESQGVRDALPIAVHQMWLFVTGRRTVVSFVMNGREDPDTLLDTNLQQKIINGISESSNDEDIAQDAYVMAAYMARCACTMHVTNNQTETQMILYLEQMVALLSGKRIEAYNSLSAKLSNVLKAPRSDVAHSTRSSDLVLLLEVIDKLEELRSFAFVLDSQFTVLEQMQKAFKDLARDRFLPPEALSIIEKTLKDLTYVKAKVDRLVTSVLQVQTTIFQLMDLKQKEANIAEAYYTRVQAEQTAKDGRILLVFTLVTTIFLPLSFFASYSAMNTSQRVY